MQKKWQKIWSIQKNSVPLHAFSSINDEVSLIPLIGDPENFNFWGEREQGENSYERYYRESY